MTSSLEITPNVKIPFGELDVVTSRSGGPGGQNVNKLETRVEVRFDIRNSSSLTDRQKALLEAKLRSRIDAEGILRVVSQESRSQWRNKQIVLERLAALLREALRPVKHRKRTKPTISSKESRLKGKHIRSEKKRSRRPPDDHD